ncbi:AMP-binding protein [Nocardioides sp. MAH-18]|uniref:Acyl-CoA synthetase n=1 Tax=Nocardioides agri TaxID=2682843 RepID=A0A6L6XM51_9ACTN|nr:MULTISPECIES: AMP-dependent synthetase/ligase [unclassified Nocardioides]MBA2956509.1 AMP-binding protein [Nocardioides sp. CGMCC 1.13656]MVQ47656.1 AMP-binding protein [Nocardioides sp. MAH-18]
MTAQASPPNVDASFVDRLSQNCAVQFLDRVAASADKEAFRYPRGETWESMTWRQTGEQVQRLAAGLLSLGLQSEQRVGIASGTRYEWILADLAIMCAAGATTTVYPTTNAEDTTYILADAECRVVFAEDDEQVAKLTANKAELPHLAKVVTFDGTADGDWIIGLDDLAKLGDAYLAEHPGVIEETAKSIAPDQLATLIYTSGTTGRPKGVRLLHRAWVYEGTAIQVQDILHEDDLQFLWLPMAHSFGKVLLSAQLACGFATAVDGRVERIVDNCAIVKPTFMGAAPRIFEKAHARIITMQAAEGGLKEKIFLKAFEVGVKVDRLKREGKSVPLLLALQKDVFDKLVFSKVRERFGGRVRFFISGSAALNADIAEWFHAAGILILEGYGMTENAAGATVNHPSKYKIGTVGPALPGSEVRIGDNDEVLLRGPHIMAGYHNLPEETASTLTEDGWLHTGDKGSLDADGYLTITGRIKDLFKTSGGKYVAPPAIESKFKAICPYASQFLVFGNERNFVSALITLDPDAMAGWAEENGMAGESYTEIVRSDAVQSMVGGYVEQLNEKLNRWETIKKWKVLDHDLTIESGELTPSMKVKRNVVEENNKTLIDSFYS